MFKFVQIFESLLLTEFAMDFSETYIDETMDIGPQSNTAGIWNLSSVPRLCPNLSKSGQIFELLLLPEFTMDLSETYTDETMDEDPQTYEPRIWNLSSVPRLCPNYDKSLNCYSSLSLQWISLKLMSMKLWKWTLLKLMKPESGNLSSVPRLHVCPNLDKCLNRYFSLSLQWISLKLIAMQLWI